MSFDPRAIRKFKIWYHGWNIVAIAFVFQIIVYGVIVPSFSFWVPGWMSDFHQHRAPIMVASALELVVAALLAPVAGRLMDRWYMNGVVAIGLTFFAIGFLLLSFAKYPWQITAVYTLAMGPAVAFAGPVVAQTLAAKWFQARRGLAMGIVLTGSGAGGILVPLLIVPLLSTVGWRGTALIVATIGVALIPFVFLVIRNLPEAISTNLELQAPRDRATFSPRDMQWTTKDILFNRNFWVLVGAFLPFYIASLAIFTNFRLLALDHHLSAKMSEYAFAASATCTLTGKILIGRLSDFYNQKILLFAAIMLFSGSLLLMTCNPGVVRFDIASVLAGFGISALFTMQGAIVARYFGTASFGRVLGLLSFIFALAALGGPLAGLVRDMFGSYDLFLIGAAIVQPLMALLIFWLRPNEPQVSAAASLLISPTVPEIIGG
jgi:MFS transporter, OFA family, oxalate/formate antiporter